MCGITGFNWEDKELSRKITSIIEHRGPDDKDYYLDKGISLGHRRLSIIDLSKNGKQPMSDSDDEIVITFNGEIYNFKEIKKELKEFKFKSNTDTEVIIYAYKKWGIKCLDKLNGMFSFCIYDKRKKIFFLARDRIGIKPLYFFHNDDKFLFASEIKSILEYEEVPRDINPESLNRFITLRYLPGRKTLFKNIQKLLPGEYMIFDLKKCNLNINSYWNIKKEDINKSEEYYSKKTLELLEDSVEKRLLSDVPLGAYLSGGLDSSTIVSLMHKIKQKREDNNEIKTFSVGFEDDKAEDVLYAKKISEIFNTDHKEIMLDDQAVKLLPKIIWNLDEPMADPALIPMYSLSKNAKKKVTVILTGDGGDEIFAGYDQYKFLKWGDKLKNLPYTTKISSLMKKIPSPILNKVYKYSSDMGNESFKKVDSMIGALKENNSSKAYYELLSVINDEERKDLIRKEKFRTFDYEELNKNFFTEKKDILRNLTYFDTKNLLPESFLMKTDRMTMAHGVEGRVPFLDHNLVQFAHNIPSKLKLKGNIPKYILKKSLEKNLPKEVIYRKKQTFNVPIQNWLEKNLKEYRNSFLNEREISDMGLFNYKYIQKISDNYKKGKLFYARQMWNLMCFKIWYDKFIKNER